MKKQITRISILQSSKIVTVLYILFGFIYTLVGVPMIIFSQGNRALQIMGIVYTAMPIIAGILGFIFFVISSAIYNLLASWLGGFEFETKEIE